MSFLKWNSTKSYLSCLAVLVAVPASVPVVQAQNGGISGPVVVELFMSQSCGRCTPATENLMNLAANKDVIALSWHVDYWNDMKTRKGQWVDPFSNAAFTTRQRHYNEHIRRKNSVYTPQMIIGGISEAPGAKTKKVATLIDEVRAENRVAAIDAERRGDEMVFDIKGNGSGGDAFLVTFLPFIETDIDNGENSGRTLQEVNVITEIKPLGIVPVDGKQLSASIPADDLNCALIVQEPDQGSIIAATYCPGSA